MARRKRRELALDILVGLAAALALSFLVRERLVPWIAERAVLDPGETLREAPSLLDARTGDSIQFREDAAMVLLVFRSTCPTCERAVPAWSRLVTGGPKQTMAVGLEGPATAADYVGERLPGVRVTVPRYWPRSCWAELRARREGPGGGRMSCLLEVDANHAHPATDKTITAVAALLARLKLSPTGLRRTRTAGRHARQCHRRGEQQSTEHGSPPVHGGWRDERVSVVYRPSRASQTHPPHIPSYISTRNRASPMRNRIRQPMALSLTR